MYPCLHTSHKGLTLGEQIVICTIVFLIAAIAVPGFISSRRASNERNASMTLKTLATAEADFRANDRDWNHVNDFWTGDVKGLYTLTSARVPGAGIMADDPPIRLIELLTAGADADPALVPAGGENMPLAKFAPPAPKAGYWYAALLTDLTVKDTPEAVYKQDTEGTPRMGKCHNTSRFGFVAFPDSSSSGKYIFRVNENNTIFREAVTGQGRTETSIPPGLNAIPPAYLNWPSHDELKLHWEKID